MSRLASVARRVRVWLPVGGLLVVTAVVSLGSASCGSAAGAAAGAFARVNGLRLYYQVHGTGGVPLVLLPGGGSTIESTYGEVLASLAERGRVIAIDEQNHGRSGHRAGPERFTDSADDVAELVRQLGHTQVDVMGFSNGATVALQVAIRHPSLVRKLVFASGLAKRGGAAPEFWEFMERATFDDMPQSLKDDFLAVNADRAQLRAMYDKDAHRMRTFADIPTAQIRAVRAQTLILGGDRDVPTLEHLHDLSRWIPRARLVVLPTGHGEYLGEQTAGSRFESEVTVALVDWFLD